MGLVGLVIAFAPAIGPSLSGWLVENHSWHFIFLVILPIAFVVLVVTHFVLKNVTEQTRPKIDVLSIFLSSLGFGGLLYGFSSAGNNGWGSVEAVGVLTIGGVSLALFIWRQFILKNPMLEFRVFQYGIFPLTTLISMIVYILMISVGLILSLYMQNMRGFTPIETGLLILPGGLAMGMMSLISGRIFDKFGARWLAVIGLGIVTVATFPFVNLDASTPYTYILVLYTVRMLGLAMVLAPIGTAGLNQLPFHLIPHGTAMSNTMRQVAASTGTALLVTVMTNGAASARQQMMTQPEIHGVDIAFGVTAGLAFVGFILAFFVRSKSLESKRVMEE